MTKYFDSYAEDPSTREEELRDKENRAQDDGGDILPFQLLGGRRFESLSAQVKRVIPAYAGCQIRLMAGVAERGRDVLVYRNNQLVEIIQCKNHQKRLTATDVFWELGKVALHAFLEPGILSNQIVTYEFWSPAGFSESAAHLVDTWPLDWNESGVRSIFDLLVKEYKAFTGLQFDDVKGFLINELPKKLHPRMIDGYQITGHVRSVTSLYETYFRGIVVMKRDEVMDAISSCLRKEGMRQVDAEDKKHILDRIDSFEASSRLFFGFGYIMGLPPETIRFLTADEMKTVHTNAMAGTVANSKVILLAAQRKISAIADECADKLNFKNRAFRYVLNQVISTRMLICFTSLFSILPDKQLSPVSEHIEKTDDELIRYFIGQVWDEASGIISEYKPGSSPPGSDPEYRNRIAIALLSGASNRQEYERELGEDFVTNDVHVRASLEAIKAFVPRQLMVVADTQSVFLDEKLLKRFEQTLNLLDEP